MQLKNFKILLSAGLVLLACAASANPPLGLEWGMSLKEVYKTTKAEDTGEYADVMSNFTEAEKDEIIDEAIKHLTQGKDSNKYTRSHIQALEYLWLNAAFFFENDKMNYASLSIEAMSDDLTLGDVLTDYYFLKEMLVEKYGEPIYQDQPVDSICETRWISNGTVVSLFLRRYRDSFYLTYEPEEEWNGWRSELKAKL